MKYLVILILLLVQTISYTQQTISDTKKQKLIQGIQNGDYSVLLPFVKKDNINTFIPLRNGRIVIREQFEKPPVTKPFTFKNADKTIIYTNQYGFQFLNDKEILWDLDEINSMPNAVCFGFYDMMKKAFKAKDPKDIIALYNEYNDSIFTIYFSGLVSWGLGDINDLYNIDIEYSLEDRQNIADYLFSLIYPTKKRQRIALLNLPLHRLAIYNGEINTIRVHANDKIRPLLFSDDEEYKCLSKE